VVDDLAFPPDLLLMSASDTFDADMSSALVLHGGTLQQHGGEPLTPAPLQVQAPRFPSTAQLLP
jgi:hypothetical protein